MDEAEAWPLLAEERRALADVLDGLSAEQWRTQSLCGAWNVAEVATHIMVGPTGTLPGFATAMVRARGRFARANRVLVERKIHRPTTAITADLRDHAASRFKPPGGSWRDPVTDFLIHRLDALVPLGLEHGRSLELWCPALDHLLSPAARRGFPVAGLPALTYAATDLDWSEGDGPRVEAPVESLALAVTRRPTARVDDLTGPGAATLRSWAEQG